MAKNIIWPFRIDGQSRHTWPFWPLEINLYDSHPGVLNMAEPTAIAVICPQRVKMSK